MVTYDMIMELRKKIPLSSKFEIYNGEEYGVGIAYPVIINDYGTTEYRLATFNTREELEDFIIRANYSDEIRTDYRELINSTPTFYFKGKILTDQKLEELKEEKRKTNSSLRKFNLYQKRRGQLILYKVKAISEEIEELKKLIENQKRKRNLLLNNKLETYVAKGTVEVEDLPEDIDEVLPRDIPNLKIKYNQLLKEKFKLEKILEVLILFSKRSTIVKLLLSQKNIDKAISNVEDDKDTDNNNIITTMKVDHARDLVVLFEKYRKPSYFVSESKYYQTCLEILKEYDELPKDETYEQFVVRAEERLKQLSKQLVYDEKIEPVQSEQDKMTKLFENLKSQFDKNLNEEQKDALIIYNSRLFELINKITSIHDYKSMDSRKILEHLKNSPRYNEMVAIIYTHSITIIRDAFYEFNNQGKKLKNIFKKVLTPDLCDIIVHTIFFKDKDYKEFDFSYTYNLESKYPDEFANIDTDDDIYTLDFSRKLFDRILCHIIDNLKKQIDILNSIPDDAIVLPEDITVFRGVNSLRERTEEIPANSSFMSTSTKPELAKLYGGENCYIYKIKLKKGTPVLITPYKVHKTMAPFELMLVPANPSDPKGTKEILIKLVSMQDFEITEHTAKTPHYSYKNGKFIETENGYIITGEMKPKNKLLDQGNQMIYNDEI